VATKIDRIQIEYDLKFQTPFHFGTGFRIGLIDRTIVRDSGKYLYVPGSTFKGVLREHCEQIARLYEELDENMRELIASPHEEDIALLGLGQVTTMITRIFGSHNHPGRLYFDDARQAEEDTWQYDAKGDKGRYLSLQTDLYTQVRLDRPTRTAVKGALYTSEFGVRDIVFHGAITGWLECDAITAPINAPPTYSLLLLLAGLRIIDRLGGNKSTGKGKCECDITSIAINEKDCPKEQWQAWLNYLDALSYYSTETTAQQEEEV